MSHIVVVFWMLCSFRSAWICKIVLDMSLLSKNIFTFVMFSSWLALDHYIIFPYLYVNFCHKDYCAWHRNNYSCSFGFHLQGETFSILSVRGSWNVQRVSGKWCVGFNFFLILTLFLFRHLLSFSWWIKSICIANNYS